MNKIGRVIKPTEVAGLIHDLTFTLQHLPSERDMWYRLAMAIKEEEVKLTKLIHIKIDMAAKFHEVSDIDFQILFSRIRIKVLKEILDEK